ncbi:MAG TPA: hypothetical protein VG692_16495 [Gemmatimonadales bacterium]|nr:hypothetical protein [Gemmatimonadales bacterium]
MSQDLLAPYRTQPSVQAPATAAGEPEKHRSVADGELASAWTLKEFFGALNTVMRLPARARRKKETAKAEGAGSRIAFGLSPALSRFVLVGGGIVVVAVTIVKPLIDWATDSSHASLTQVAGVWEAGKGKHQGRHFEVTDSAVVFHTGDSPTDYTWHKVQQVKVRSVGDSTLYTVTYEEGKRTADLAFWYYQRPAPAIRLKNQPAVLWSLTRLQPVAGPPPSTKRTRI